MSTCSQMHLKKRKRINQHSNNIKILSKLILSIEKKLIVP